MHSRAILKQYGRKQPGRRLKAANTLIPVDYDASLFESTDAIISKKEELREVN